MTSNVIACADLGAKPMDIVPRRRHRRRIACARNLVTRWSDRMAPIPVGHAIEGSDPHPALEDMWALAMCLWACGVMALACENENSAVA